MVLLQTLILVVAIVTTGSGLAQQRRRQSIAAIERAMYPEITSMRVQASAMAAEITRRHLASAALDETFFLQWRLSAPLIYPTVGASIGLLSRDAIDRIGYFHAQLSEARLRLAEARTAHDRPFAPYRLISNLCRACNHVEGWTRIHEPQFGPPNFGYPDMTEADALFEALEAHLNEPMARPYEWADSCWPMHGPGE